MSLSLSNHRSKLSDQNDSCPISSKDNNKNAPLLLNDVEDAVPQQNITAATTSTTLSSRIYGEQGRRYHQTTNRGTYQSTADPSMIPDAAQHMTWLDPHFHNNNNTEESKNIIAVFDIDQNALYRYSFGTYLNLFYIAVFPHVLVRHYLSDFLTASESLFIFLAILIIAYLYQLRFRTQLLRYYKLHIALATDGIYIDERNPFGNPVRYHRTIIPYRTISTCRQQTYRFLYRDYVHISFLDEKGETINSLLNCIDGHRFIYLVNVMIDKSKVDHHRLN